MSSLNWQDGMKDWGATEEAAEGVQKGKPGISSSEKEENTIPTSAYMLHLEQSTCIHSWKVEWEVLEQV